MTKIITIALDNRSLKKSIYYFSFIFNSFNKIKRFVNVLNVGKHSS